MTTNTATYFFLKETSKVSDTSQTTILESNTKRITIENIYTVYVYLTLLLKRRDVINKHQVRLMTSQQLFHESGIYPVYYSRACLLLLISYRYLQIIM
jgi:hypothetical protein